MRAILRLAAICGLIWAAGAGALAADAKIKLVAAENFYGNIARQIAGDRIDVVSIMENPDQDPHLFETTPGVARALSAANIVVMNGADYDPWMAKLLKAAPRAGRTVITVAELVGKKAGDNPHLWYDPPTAPAVAKAIAAALSLADPAHKADYEARLKTFLASLAPIQKKIAAMRARHAGVAVTATEPVFGYMASALGLKMRNERFQMAVMNDTEPSARDLAAFEDDLKQHKVKVLFYNKQVTDKLTERLLAHARSAHIAVVGITETAPSGVSFQDWMTGQLDDVEKALAGPSS
jgi:zinc/manganese transport system substrate-binding protein